MFICPNCQQDHRTLGTLLQCCRRELRAFTDQLVARGQGEDGKGDMALVRLLLGKVSAVLRREAAARLAPTDQEAA